MTRYSYTVANAYDDWISGPELVRRIKGEDATKRSAEVFYQNVASKPDFPKPSKFGGTKVWCWGEVCDYFRKQREKQEAGRPRNKRELA